MSKELNIRLPNDEVETVHVGDTVMKIMGVVKWIVRGFDAGHVQLATSMEGIAGFGIPFHEFAKEWVLISDDDEEENEEINQMKVEDVSLGGHFRYN